RIVGLEPVARLRAVAEIATGLAVDPVREVDPVGYICRRFAIPGKIFGEVAVRFSGIDAEALEDVEPDLLLLRIDGMSLESGDQLVLADLAAAEADIDIPGLVVDAGADEVELARPGAEDG